MAATPTGRLMKKIHRQLHWSTIAPPSTGPKIGASSIGTPIRLITLPIRCGPAAWARIVWPTGRIIPAPTPCSTRKPISDPIDQDAPASVDPSRNRSSEASQTRLAPKRSLPHPVSGITLAKASMYPVSTHWMVEIDAAKSRPSVGIATFTIVRSRTVMIIPRTTTAPSTRTSRSRPFALPGSRLTAVALTLE